MNVGLDISSSLSGETLKAKLDVRHKSVTTFITTHNYSESHESDLALKVKEQFTLVAGGLDLILGMY